MLEEVRAEVEAGENAGFVAARHVGAAQDHSVLAVKARQSEVVVERVDTEAWQGADVVFIPAPDIAHQVVESGPETESEGERGVGGWGGESEDEG